MGIVVAKVKVLAFIDIIWHNKISQIPSHYKLRINDTSFINQRTIFGEIQDVQNHG